MFTPTSTYYTNDYLNPNATPVVRNLLTHNQGESRKSHLALLAETCSSIGLDSTPTKSPNAASDKKDSNKEENANKANPANIKLSKSPDTSKNSLQTFSEKHHDEKSSDTSKKDHHSSSSSKHVPSINSLSNSKHLIKHEMTSDREKDVRSASSVESLSHSYGHHKNNISSLSNQERLSNNTPPKLSPVSTSPSSSLRHESIGAPLGPHYYPNHPSHPTYAMLYGSSDTKSNLPMPMHPLYSHSSPSKIGLNGLHPSLPGFNPFHYAYLKSAMGSASSLHSLCRDPLCKSCPPSLSGHPLVPGGHCPPGCTQCTNKTHLPSSANLNSHLSDLTSLDPYSVSSLSGFNPSSPLSYAYPYVSFSAHHPQPYICNWVNGAEYCGRRFSTSEELFSHLRTHTSSNDVLSALSYHAGLGLNSSALTANSQATPYHPSQLYFQSLSQSYPKSASPSSMLSPSRYHPYKIPSAAHSAAPSHIYHPGHPYYSPYALYGSRLGSVP